MDEVLELLIKSIESKSNATDNWNKFFYLLSMFQLREIKQ